MDSILAMNRLRQWRQGAAHRRKSQRNYKQWLGRQPASHVIDHIELVTASAKWLITLHGAGLAASVAFMIAAYTSLPGALDHVCVAVYSGADSFHGGQAFGQFFVLGGMFAPPAAAMPGIVRFGRNCVKDYNHISSRIERNRRTNPWTSTWHTFFAVTFRHVVCWSVGDSYLGFSCSMGWRLSWPESIHLR